MKKIAFVILVFAFPMLVWAADPESLTAVLPAIVALYQAGAGWYALASLGFWAALQVVLHRKGFRVPYVSDKLAELDRGLRGLIVAFLGIAVGITSAVSTGDPMLILEAGLLGLGVALGAAGFHSAVAKPVLDKLEVE